MTQNTLSNPALLLIDIQNDYFPGGKYPLTGSIEASLEARKVLDAFRARNLPIFHIQHEKTGPDPNFFAPGTEGQQIQDNVLPLPEEPVLTKHKVSSFVQTSLLENLQNKKIDTVVLVGMQTNVCVQGTTTDALKHGFDVIVLKEATAAVDEATHSSTLKTLAEKGATVMSIEEVLVRLP